MTDFLFVYGTLLKGEQRNFNLKNCELKNYMSISGEIYDTGFGYPAAIYTPDSKNKIYGELYKIEEDKNQLLKELDTAEGVNEGIFIRKILNIEEKKFYFYESGKNLRNTLNSENLIKTGSWLQHKSLAIKDVVKFAKSFEKHHSNYYRKEGSSESTNPIYIEGGIPILVTAPHATNHFRKNKLKRYETLTACIAAILHAKTGCSSLYTNSVSKIDPNYYDESPFKEKIERIIKKNKIKFLIDLHGTGEEKSEDIYPGIGNNKEFLFGNNELLNLLNKTAVQYNISLGDLDIFSASKQMTVTKFAAKKLGISSLQLEINKRLRKPDSNPEKFEILTKFLSKYISLILKEKIF